MATLTRDFVNDSGADAPVRSADAEVVTRCRECNVVIENPRKHRRGPKAGQVRQEFCGVEKDAEGNVVKDCRAAWTARQKQRNEPAKAAPARFKRKCCSECGTPFQPREHDHRHCSTKCRVAERHRREKHGLELERALSTYKGRGFYGHCKANGVEQLLTYQRQDHREVRRAKWAETAHLRAAEGFDDKGKRIKQTDSAAVVRRDGRTDGRDSGAHAPASPSCAGDHARPSTERAGGEPTRRVAGAAADAEPGENATVGNDASAAVYPIVLPVRPDAPADGEPPRNEPFRKTLPGGALIDRGRLAAGADRIGPTHRFKEGVDE